MMHILPLVLYPSFLCAALMGCAVLLQQNFSLFWTVSIPVVLFTSVLVVLEMRWPASGRRHITRQQARVDLTHGLLWHGFLPGFLKALVAAGCARTGGFISTALGFSLWPSHWPAVLQLLLALSVGEFFAYWIHRFGHETSIGWRIHALHHSPSELNALSAGRNHPINVTASYLGQMVPLWMLGAPAEVLAFHAVFTGVNGPLQHVNLPFRCGALNWLLSTPELHRWHHSKIISESNANYGSNLIVWDLLFKTRRIPKENKEPAQYGLLHPFPQNFPEQLLWFYSGHQDSFQTHEKEKEKTHCGTDLTLIRPKGPQNACQQI